MLGLMKRAVTGSLSPDQWLLLQAALADRPHSYELWRRWSARNRIEDADPLSHRLFALIPSHTDHLAGIRRYYWVDSMRRGRLAAQAVKTLHDAGVACLVVGALATAARPCPAASLIVRPEDRRAALAALRSSGWSDTRGGAQSILLRHGDAGRLKLGWNVSRRARWPGCDDLVWERALTRDFHGQPASLLCPEDELLLAVVGLEPGWWPVDASLLLRGADADLSLVLAQAEHWGVAGWVAAALDGLGRPFSAGSTSVRDWLLAAQAAGLTGSGLLLDYLSQGPPGERPGAVDFVRFVQRRWSLGSPLELPGAVARRLLRRL